VADQASHTRATSALFVSRSLVSRVWWCWSLFVLLLQELRQPSSFRSTSVLFARSWKYVVCSWVHFRRGEDNVHFGFFATTTPDFRLSPLPCCLVSDVRCVLRMVCFMTLSSQSSVLSSGVLHSCGYKQRQWKVYSS
jgi:hypothetical protein